MRRHFSFEPASITDALNNPRDKGRTVQHAHLARDADVGVDEGIVVGNHVLIGGLGRDGMFEGISGTVEEEAPEGTVDEVEEWEDAEGPVRR